MTAHNQISHNVINSSLKADIAGRAQKAENLADLPDKPAAQKNLTGFTNSGRFARTTTGGLLAELGSAESGNLDALSAVGPSLFSSPAAAQVAASVSAAQHFTDGVIYDRADAAPAHDGHYQVGSKWYVMRRSPVVYLEGFRSDIDLSGVTDSSTGWSKALGRLSELGTKGGKLVLPREAILSGFFQIPYDNVEIDANGTELRALTTGQGSILFFEGTKSASARQLSFLHSRGAQRLDTASGTSIPAGALILVKDDSVRLSDSAGDINNEVHMVASDTGTVLRMFEPLHFTKDVAALANIYTLTPRNGIRIWNARTRALPGSIANIGLFARYCRGVETGGCQHFNGAGEAWTFRGCYDVKAHNMEAGTPQSVGSGQGYGLSLIQGTRHVQFSVKGTDQRHTLDTDTAYFLKGRVESLNEQGSVVLGHNGAIGDVDLELDIRGASALWGVGTTSWNVSTGQGSSAESFQHHNITLKGTVIQRRTGGINYAAYFQQPVRSMDLRLDCQNGDYEGQDTVNSAAVRLWARSNSGTAAIKSRGYRTGWQQYAATQVATEERWGVEVSLDFDWGHYAFHYEFADNINIREFRLGANITTGVYFQLVTGSTAILRAQHIGRGFAASTTIANYQPTGSDSGRTSRTRGSLGGISAPFDYKAVATPGFTITRADMFAYGGKIIPLSVTGSNIPLTAIDDGMFEGQELTIVARGAGTVQLSDISNQLILRSSPTSQVCTKIVWQDSRWWEV